MPQIINTNVMSLNSQRNLNKSQRGLATALNRLSSGLRINSAKDDAAGLAISERFTSQIKGLSQASRNANDGISLAQTAEGALGEVSNMLQRIRELSVQSANSTNSTSDRSALQNEVIELKNEIERVSATTEFNGSKLLNGDFGNGRFQVGANAGQTINVSINSISTSTTGAYKLSTGSNLAESVTTANANGATGGYDLTITGKDSGGTASTVAVTAGDSAYDIATAINAETSNTGVTAEAYTKAGLGGLDVGTVTFVLRGKNTTNVSINAQVTATSGSGLNELANAINTQSATTGITARVDGGEILMEQSDGYDIAISSFTSTGGAATLQGYAGDSTSTAGATTALTNGGATPQGTVGGQIDVYSSAGFTLTEATAEIFAATSNAGALQKVSDIDVSTIAGSNNGIHSIDAAIDSVNSIRAKLGALQSRFESTVSNLQTSVENLSAARSRIQDADFAAETAELTRTQILQQAGTAMLAQANSIPQNVLSLLG